MYSQNNQESEEFNPNRVRVLFYNLENFFDVFNDTLKNDDDFLPKAARRWNSHKYIKKLNNISKVIIAAGEWNPPDIIGLAEVENKFVLLNLIHKTPLAKFDYQFIHYDSPDERGIDVALLYKPEVLKPIYSKSIQINYPDVTRAFKTRDILYVKALILNKDTFHIFINHWPSRKDGHLKSEYKRIYCAELLKTKVDSIFNVNSSANIIVSGDFNDEPTDKSIMEVLHSVCDTNATYPCLINLMCNKDKNWSYTYKSKMFTKYYTFDQFIVSNSILQYNKYISNCELAKTFKPDWLLNTDKFNYPFPFSTYYAYRYLGGFSDHLPIIFDVFFKPSSVNTLK